jgi:hypothetical protein
MIVLGCIEFHPKGCARYIIVMRLRVFINYVLSNMKNISGGGIRYLCKRCKNKKSQSSCCYDASSIKKIHGKIFVLVCT